MFFSYFYYYTYFLSLTYKNVIKRETSLRFKDIKTDWVNFRKSDQRSHFFSRLNLKIKRTDEDL